MDDTTNENAFLPLDGAEAPNGDMCPPARPRDDRRRRNDRYGRGGGGGGVVRVLAATYGPSDGQTLPHGEPSNTEAARLPFTRDVLPFLRAVLLARGREMGSSEDDDTVLTSLSGEEKCAGHRRFSEERAGDVSDWVVGGSGAGRRPRSALPLMDGMSMNELFGDPCPGTTKRLRVRYVFCDDDGDDDRSARIGGLGGIVKSGVKRYASAEVCRASFAEHELVVLRRKRSKYQDVVQMRRALGVSSASKRSKRKAASLPDVGEAGVAIAPSSAHGLGGGAQAIGQGGESSDDEEMQPFMPMSETDNDEEDEDEEALAMLRRMGRSQSIAEMAVSEAVDGTSGPLSPLVPSRQIAVDSSTGATLLPGSTLSFSGSAEIDAVPNSARINLKNNPRKTPSIAPPKKWRLRSSSSEIVLPITLPYLDVRQRAMCQLVCKVWRFVVRDSGVAQTVDVNDPSFPNFTRSFLRGIMKHSYSSLHSLFLNGFHELTPGDLHPAIPHLQKLQTLDVSGCHQLDDSTLLLLSDHLATSLEVLYMKGLRRATDIGLVAVSRSCLKLRVLDISAIPITDEGGLAIGENLTKLEALYMRDNYLLTNRSVDVVTEQCMRLTQLTLWGCTKLRHLSFDGSATNNTSGIGSTGSLGSMMEVGGCGKLVLLNLWGCHSLVDETAGYMGSLHCLKSLIVSECHRLTDAFVVKLAQTVPHIFHLHLRYLKKLTDVSVNAIANSMHNLYSLDMSFCTRISAPSLVHLLEVRYDSLSELRLYSCHQLDIYGPRQRERHQIEGVVPVGRMLLDAVRSRGASHCLCLLDVRECGDATPHEPREEDDTFVRGMLALMFEEKVRDFFIRPARWNAIVHERLTEHFVVGHP